MRLHSISYTEYEEESYAWKLSDLELGSINLVVGKNSSGKTRILRIINGLARLIEGAVSPSTLETGHYVVKFAQDADEQPSITYELEIYKKEIRKEFLVVNRSEKLSRGEGGRGWVIFEKQDGAQIDIQIPQDQLAVTARRDNRQHSFFEPFHEWASRTRFMEFQATEARQSLSMADTSSLRSLPDKVLFDDVVSLYRNGIARWGREFSAPVLAAMRRVGFNLTEVGVTQHRGISINIGVTGNPYVLYIIEQGVSKQIFHPDISGGMFGALATIIRLSYMQLEKKRHCILIDDIGEGLDFERSSNLIQLVIDNNKEGFQQLVMTTNDRFVMNKVDVEYWCIVERSQGTVTVFNAKTSPEAFGDFKEYGFMNFDFFAKRFYSKSIKESPQ